MLKTLRATAKYRLVMIKQELDRGLLKADFPLITSFFVRAEWQMNVQ